MRLTGPAPAGARVGAPVLDYATGMAALSAILAALMERQHSGRGQVVQVNMLAVAHELMTAQRTDLQLTGREPVHRGNAANSGEPLSSVFETADGHLALAINEEHQFAKLAQALGHADWPSDARFADRRLRRQHADTLRTLVQQALMTRDALQWERLLCEAGVAAAAVRTLAQALHHPGAEPSQGQGLFHLQRGRLPFAQLHPAHAYSTDPS
jgi:CoA:oxalate CoA-transferase